jgi:hypothetical protein
MVRWPIEIDGLPIKNGGFSMAMLNNQMAMLNKLNNQMAMLKIH